jgi:hypothetical protein
MKYKEIIEMLDDDFRELDSQKFPSQPEYWLDEELDECYQNYLEGKIAGLLAVGVINQEDFNHYMSVLRGEEDV